MTTPVSPAEFCRAMRHLDQSGPNEPAELRDEVEKLLASTLLSLGYGDGVERWLLMKGHDYG